MLNLHSCTNTTTLKKEKNKLKFVVQHSRYNTNQQGTSHENGVSLKRIFFPLAEPSRRLTYEQNNVGYHQMKGNKLVRVKIRRLAFISLIRKPG